MIARLRAAAKSPAAGRAVVAVQRLAQPRRPAARTAVFFLDSVYRGSSADLRGRAVAAALRPLGWRTVVVPPWVTLDDRRRLLRAERPGVLVLQQSRHPLHRPRLYPGVRCLFDVDDADYVETPDDVAECVRGSRAVVAGNRFLAAEFAQLGPPATTVWTGSYLRTPANAKPAGDRGPVVVWAQANPLAYPAEAELVRAALLEVAARRPFRFAVYGTAGDKLAGFLDPLRRAGVTVESRGFLPYRRFARSLADAAVGLHPVCPAEPFSRGKSFGKVLAYLAAGVPVVASDALDYPLFFQNRANGLLAANAVDAWAAAITELLDDPAARTRVAAAGYRDYCRKLSPAAAAARFHPVAAAVAEANAEVNR